MQRGRGEGYDKIILATPRFQENAVTLSAMGAGMDGTWITASTPEWLVNAGYMIFHQSSGDAKLARRET